MTTDNSDGGAVCSLNTLKNITTQLELIVLIDRFRLFNDATLNSFSFNGLDS